MVCKSVRGDVLHVNRLYCGGIYSCVQYKQCESRRTWILRISECHLLYHDAFSNFARRVGEHVFKVITKGRESPRREREYCRSEADDNYNHDQGSYNLADSSSALLTLQRKISTQIRSRMSALESPILVADSSSRYI